MDKVIELFLNIIKEKILNFKDPIRQLVLLISCLVIVWLAFRWDLEIYHKDFTEKVITLFEIFLTINFGAVFIIWVYQRHKFIKETKASSKAQRESYFARMRNRVAKMTLALGTDARREDIRRYFIEPRLVLAGEEKYFDNNIYNLHTILKRAVKRKQSGVVLFGKGGAGKTVLAQWLAGEISWPEMPQAWDFLRRPIPKPEIPYDDLDFWGKIVYWFHKLLVWLELATGTDYQTSPYAIFVSLLDLPIPKENGKDLIIAYLLSAVKSSANDNFERRQEHLAEINEHIKTTEDWISQGLIIPIIDGLDTLGLNDQERFLNGLQAFVQFFPKCGPFVLTVRETEVDVAKFKVLPVSFWEIQPFDQNQIIQYLDQAFDNKKRAKDLWIVITKTAERDPRLWTLLATPLLLGLLVNNYGDDAPIDQEIKWDRIGIYEKYFTELWRRQSKNATNIALPRSELADAAYQSLRTGIDALNLGSIETATMTRLTNLIVGYRYPNQYFFLHSSFYAYFAAEYIYCQILESETDAYLYLEELVDGVLGVFPKRNTSGKLNLVPNPVQWRDVLFFLVERLKQYSLKYSDAQNFHPFLYEIARKLYLSQILVSKVLFLRFLGTFENTTSIELVKQFQLVETVDDVQLSKQMVNWLIQSSANKPNGLGNSYAIDLAESGYGLSISAWKDLEARTRIPDETQQKQAFCVIACLHHPRAAKFIVEQCYEGVELPIEALSELRRMGLLLVSPLLDAYQRATDDLSLQKQKRLFYLMGFAAPSKDLAKVLSEQINVQVGNSHSKNQELAVIAFQALANQGNFSSNLLMMYLERISEFAERFHPILIKSLQEVRLGEPEQRRLGELLNSLSKKETMADKKSKVNRQLLRDSAVQIFRYKINPENLAEDAQEFIDLINDYPPFKLLADDPLSNKRRFLGFLWKHRRECGLYEWIRERYHLKKEFLDSVLDICDGVDSDQSKNWIILILQDRSLEKRDKAIEIFFKKNLRMNGKWFDQIKHSLPDEIVVKIQNKSDQYRLA